MKFGQNFHRFQVPTWERHYLPYTSLKALLKLATKEATDSDSNADLKEFYDVFANGVAAVDSFYQRQKESIHLEWSALYEPYNNSFSGASLGFPNSKGGLYAFNYFHLEDYCNVCKEAQSKYLELQWFCHINHEATRRIHQKLQRLEGERFAQQDEEKMKKWLDRQLEYKTELLEKNASIQRSIDQMKSRQELEVGPDLASMDPFPDTEGRPKISSDLQTIDEFLRNDRATELTPVVKRIHSLLYDFDPLQFPVLFYRFLALSISSAAWSCAKTLVLEDFAHGYLGSKFNCLNYILALIDRTPKELDPRIEHPGFREIGMTVLPQIIKDLGLSGKVEEALTRQDTASRVPLHYAAMYGLTTICELILDTLREYEAARSDIILAEDVLGRSPLQWSVVRGHTEIAKLLLRELEISGDRSREEVLRPTLSASLLIALEREDDDTIRLLYSSGYIDASFVSSSGETALYAAARLGRKEDVIQLLEFASDQNANIDTKEKARGWTPLFIASVHGHREVVELLLEAGANGSLVDVMGWTPRETAAFRGHLPTAELLLHGAPIDESSAKLVAKLPSRNATKISKFQELPPGSAYVVVNLGIMQKGKPTSPTDLSVKGLLGNSRTAAPESTLSLEISSQEANSASHVVCLPLLGDPVDDTFVFPLTENALDARLSFKLYREETTEDSRSKIVRTLVGSGTALLHDIRNCYGKNRESLVREQSVAIMGKEKMDFLGTVTFTFVIARPFSNLDRPTPSFDYLESLSAVQLVGHRGLGQNVRSHEFLQIGENTVESFLSAVKAGASLVEFDVQMTRDLVPVLYHNFSLSETGTDVPIHDLTLDQFLYASNIQSPHGEPISILGKPILRDRLTNGPARSRSLTRNHEVGAREVRDRMKHTVEYISKGFKANTRGDFIQDSFATLEEALREVPEHIAFDAEIKYPRIHEALAASVAPVTIEINVFIDTILSIVSRFAGKRNIVFSSFTPEVCILLALKQRAYPVLLITNAGKVPMADKEKRAESLQVAVRFATRWGLAGIVFASEALVMCPRLVTYVKSKGLVCGSYGPQCNVPETVKLQVDAGVDLVVADRVGLISKTLRSL